MKTRLTFNTELAKFIFVLFTVLTIYSVTTKAQTSMFRANKIYRGIEVSFGVRAYTVKSNFDVINNSRVTLEGGRAGVIVGNEMIKARAGVGFYYSSSSVCHTFELVQTDISVNYYPVQGTRLVPYLASGLTYGKNKFYGYYASQDPGKINCSAVEMPRVGGINQVRAMLGAGLEYKIVDQQNFIHIFSEVRYGLSVQENTSDAVLGKTSTGDQLTVNIGVRFGAYK